MNYNMEARYLTDLEWRICHAVNIYVFRNGVGEGSPMLVHIPPINRRDMKSTLRVIDDRVHFPVGYSNALYKIDGVRVRNPCELEMYNTYVVASNYDKGFKCSEYGRSKWPLLVLSQHSRHAQALKSDNDNFGLWLARRKMALHAVTNTPFPFPYPVPILHNKGAEPVDMSFSRPVPFPDFCTTNYCPVRPTAPSPNLQADKPTKALNRNTFKKATSKFSTKATSNATSKTTSKATTLSGSKSTKQRPKFSPPPRAKKEAKEEEFSPGSFLGYDPIPSSPPLLGEEAPKRKIGYDKSYTVNRALVVTPRMEYDGPVPIYERPINQFYDRHFPGYSRPWKTVHVQTKPSLFPFPSRGPIRVEILPTTSAENVSLGKAQVTNVSSSILFEQNRKRPRLEESGTIYHPEVTSGGSEFSDDTEDFSDDFST